MNRRITVCSDKMARWNVLGAQSALLSHLYHPIYLESITIGDMYDQHALERALYGRVSLVNLPNSYYKLNRPVISSTDISFEASKTSLEKTYESTIPCSTCNNTYMYKISKVTIIL